LAVTLKEAEGRSATGWGVAFPWLRSGTTRRRGLYSTASSTCVSTAALVPTSALAPTSALTVPGPTPSAGNPAVPPAIPGDWAGPQIPSESIEQLDRGRAWRSVVRSRQVHGTIVRVHGSVPRGFVVADDGDGHATRTPGLLLTVTLADCAPVFLADPANRAVGILHAGWRGTADGILRRGIAAMALAFGSKPQTLFAHLGPAICGHCYEVGAEVFAALDEPRPRSAAMLDLRAVIRKKLVAAGISARRVTVSPECTLCRGRRYFSHRGGDRERHLAYIGVLPRDGERLSAGTPATGRAPPAPGPGLCGDCAWSRRVKTRRSTFHLCLRHRQDPAFPKYPSLPVLRCRGFQSAEKPDPVSEVPK